MITTVLFDTPQCEIALLLRSKLAASVATQIVTGFATPDGFAAIEEPVRMRPSILQTLVVGAATYKGFECLDDLLALGVSRDALFVHLGHTRPTGGKKNPFARFHPMLHSKIYYMELPGGEACAFIGSHNMTSFALNGKNGEASVLLEGPTSDEAFVSIRAHIAEARRQAVAYDPSMKDGYAFWTREFIDGLRAEMGIPQDWQSIRTILLFAATENDRLPKVGDEFYFELPEGIAIDSLKTETHLFLFQSLPTNPRAALHGAFSSGVRRYKCKTRGAEDNQGNLEVVAQWRLEEKPRSVFSGVPGGVFRPTPPPDMEQVRAQILEPEVEEFDYRFEREFVKWEPELSSKDVIALVPDAHDQQIVQSLRPEKADRSSWQLVTGLHARDVAVEKDRAALMRANPESGSFSMVSLSRRKRDRDQHHAEA